MKTVLELRELLDTNQVTSQALVDEALVLAHQNQEKCNSFVTILDDAKGNHEKKSLLSGIPYVIKDNFSTTGILSTGSSNTLKNYIPFFNATVIEKLKEAGAVPIAKSTMDEFGMGGTGTTGHTGIVKNPWDPSRMTAGSSAGSAACVAAGVVPFALGTDTGDSIRKPAAFCGIVGYKPTYGLISRYGLFPFASSLDHVGVLTRSVEDACATIDVMKGMDERDQTSLDSSTMHLLDSLTGDIKGKKLFYIKNLLELDAYEKVSDSLKSTFAQFESTLDLLRNAGAIVEGIEFDMVLLNAIPTTYVCISCAEATSNLSNMTGFSFGSRGEGSTYIESMKNHRTLGFSPLIKRRFVIGSYVLQKENQEKFFLNAQRVRRLVVDKMNELFKHYDAMIMPCSEGVATKLEQAGNMLQNDLLEVLENHMVIGNFGGFPSITIPNGMIEELPIGVNITGKVLDDENILNIAYTLEAKMSYKNQIAKEVN